MSIRTRSLAALAGLATVVCASSASAVIIGDTSVATRAGLLASNGLVPLDLSGILTGLTTTNSYSQNFVSDIAGAYSGTLSVEIFGNVGSPGLALNQVMMIYTMTGNGPDGIDTFEFGVDSSTNLDFNDLLSATQGTILDQTSAGQAAPVTELFNNLGTNNVFTFDYQAGGNTLGAPSQTDVHSWYVLGGADVAIDFVDVNIRDFGLAQVQSLSFVDVPGLPDLNTPTPGAVALFGIAGLAGVRRRR